MCDSKPMTRSPLTRLLALPLVLPFVFACGDDGKGDDSTSGASSTDQGDGDGDTPGDGDGDTTPGDGDGDTTPGDGDGEPTGDGDGEPPCTPGELDCECSGGQCLGDLECVDNTCVENCNLGELGCACNNGLCLADLECVEGVCMDPSCVPGELGCECSNGQCLGDLVCEGDLCVEAPPCPNDNEMMCDGECIDVMENNDNCGACGVVCDWIPKGMPDMGSCVEGSCLPTIYPCVSQADGFATCDEVCASFGQTCATEMCFGQSHVFTDDMEYCNTGNVASGSPLNCASDLIWGLGDWIGCCCTQ